ncbi:telomere regulation protein Stn1-domain-containing protein [Lipomyces kononenkoae]
MGRGKHKKRHAARKQDRDDPNWRQQSVSVKGILAATPGGSPAKVTSNLNSSSRHHHAGNRRKKSRKLSYPEQIREQRMLEIQASNYSYVGIMRQLDSPVKNTSMRPEAGSFATNTSPRNNEQSGDEYSDDSYYSESPQGLQVRPALASRQPATLEIFPRSHDDQYPQLGPRVGRLERHNTSHSLHVCLSTVEIPFPIDIPSSINSRSSRSVLTSRRSGQSNAVNNPGGQLGLTEVELPFSSSPERPLAAKVVSRKHSPVRKNILHDGPPKSTYELHSSSGCQQREVELFKEFNLRSKQLGQGEIEIRLPDTDCDTLNVVPTSARNTLHTKPSFTAFADINDQLNKTEIELPDFLEIQHMTDVLPENKQKKTEKYSVTLKEGIKMIRIASSPHRQDRSVKEPVECSTGLSQTTEIGRGKQFVTLDDLPEFGSELNALARPVISHAHYSTTTITPSAPPLPKPIKRAKSKRALNVIIAHINGLPFYTRNTYFKSPVYDTWACLSIADVQALKQIPATQTYGDHFWKNHPIKYICILGICVGVTIRETNAIVQVDDGSGREIECITKDQTKFANVESIDPGSFVRVLGTIGYFRNAKQLDINTITVIRDSHAEVEFWEQMLALRNIIDKPWILQAKDFSVEDRKRLHCDLSDNEE